MEVHFQAFIKNFLEACMLLIFVSFMSKDEKDYFKIVYIAFSFSLIITLYDFYDEKGRDAVKSSLLMSIGNSLIF